MKKFLTPMAAALLVAGLLLPAAAGAADLEPVARMNAGSASIDWQPVLTSYEGMVLTVSTPSGYVIRREFKAGEAPSFSVYDSEGKARRDGTYTYELRALPVVGKDVREKLRAYRETGDRSLLAEVRGKLPQGNFVQSGSFAIADGAFMSPGLVERTVTKGLRNASGKAMRNVTANDQVIPDDLIVQQSLCVGFDCVNNESFGFDTIRLKENNTRIKFEDTSTGTFPTNDWQLTANDSASGGSSKFSIEDITGSKVPFTITAGASTNSIFVDSTGRVGFRTSTPVLDLHVATSNTPAIRLEQNNSGGFTAQTWDIAGNEANFFVRDVTGGSRLSFRIRPGAPTSSLDISADGDVGVGTGSPDEKLHVFASENANTFSLVENPNTGTEALGAVRVKSDVATVNFQAHGSGRTLARFGKTLGGWTEMLQTTGNGLILGTNGNTNLVLGTNATNRLEIGGTGGVTVTGNFTVTGGTKNFAVVDPADSRRAIYYAALEGPEAGTYFRGTARIKGGEAVIELPGYFSRITESERVTVQLTPIGTWGQLYVAERSPERVVIRAAPGTADLEFDYFVQGVRKGYLDFEVERKNDLPNQ